jgi:hypothetical protein
MAGDRIALVIEQDLAVRDVAYLVLDRVGYRVVLAADVRHGVALVNAGLAPTLLIIDAALLPVHDTCIADLPRVVVIPDDLETTGELGDRDAVIVLPATAAELGNAIQTALCRGFVRRRASTERARHARARSVVPAA